MKPGRLADDLVVDDCIAMAEALDATFVTLAPDLGRVGATCPVRVFGP